MNSALAYNGSMIWNGEWVFIYELQELGYMNKLVVAKFTEDHRVGGTSSMTYLMISVVLLFASILGKL